jgi:cyclophilin family peptidyl-prolyl cis-trans isomerase
VGTEKRERQKANRAMRQQQLAKVEQQERRKRTAGKVAVGVIVAVLAVLGIAWIGGAFDDDDEGDVATAPEATVPVASTPVATVPDVGATTVPGTAAPGDTAPTGSQAPAPSEPPATGTAECPPADGSAEQVQEFDGPPPMCIDPTKTYTAEVVTTQGALTIELDAEQAPMTVNNFVFLARYRYFDGTPCHRIIPNFVAQCGDPTGTGTGGPGYEFDDELPEAGEYQIGSVAMANSGPNTNGSQFFIITGEDGAALPPQYSLFGQVTDGLDTTVPALDAVGNPENNGVPPLEEVLIETVTITES